jgi:hypothetical protein
VGQASGGRSGGNGYLAEMGTMWVR